MDRFDPIDYADLWPRYYFDFEVAKAEVIAFLKKRKKFIPDKSVWVEKYFDRSEKEDNPGSYVSEPDC